MSDKELDFDKIAAGLGAERRGPVRAAGGWFGALQLAADVKARFQHPERGGRATDPAWTERRLLPLAPETLRRLEGLSSALREQHIAATPLQIAAVLLERAVAATDVEDTLGVMGEVARE